MRYKPLDSNNSFLFSWYFRTGHGLAFSLVSKVKLILKKQLTGDSKDLVYFSEEVK